MRAPARCVSKPVDWGQMAVTSLQTAPQTVVPEFHLSHRVLKTAHFQWGFRLRHGMCEVSLLSSCLHAWCTASVLAHWMWIMKFGWWLCPQK